MTVVVGIDLSLTSTGLACVDDGAIVQTYNVKSKGHLKDSLALRGGRLQAIADEVVRWCSEGDCDLVVIESPSYGSQHGSQHDRSGLWWMVVSRLRKYGTPVATVSPQGRAKYGTGKGNSPKDEVLAAVIKRYPDVDITGNDIADACLLAAMGARYLGQPVKGERPSAASLAAMAGAAWPEVMSL